MVAKKLLAVFLGLFLISVVSAWSVDITKLNGAAVDTDYGVDVTNLHYQLNGINCSQVNDVLFSDDGGLNNVSKGGCAETGGEVYLPNLMSNQDDNDWMIIVENIDNTTEVDSVNFWVDSIEPVLDVVNIDFPLAYTNQRSFSLEVLLDEDNPYEYGIGDNVIQLKHWWLGDSMTYTLENKPINSSNMSSFRAPSSGEFSMDGNRNYSLWTKDTIGHEVTIYGNIIIDTVNPNISITSPLDASNSTSVVEEIQYNVQDTNLDYCEFDNGTDTINTGCSNGANTYNTNSVEGNNVWNITAYDKAGNSNISSVSFFVDSLAPNVEILSPVAGSYAYDFTELNFSVFDVALESCWFDNGTDVVIINCSENLTGITSVDGVNTWKLYANDSFGHVNSSTVVFTVDTTPPVINLTGSNPLNIELGDPYVEYGATATDNIDNDTEVTNNIVIDNSSVNTSALGSYNVTYDVSDAAGNVADTVIRTVNVVDTEPPVITLNGSNTQYVEYNTSYVELNATVTDNSGESITAVINDSAVDVNTLGSYNVSYYAEDSSGNNATVLREVVVQDTTNPVISIVPGNDTVERMDSHVDAGATALDNYDGNLTANITVNDTVNENVAGNYTIEYSVVDSNGNTGTAVRNVTVEDTVAPTIRIFKPEFNKTYDTNEIPLEVASDESIFWKYSLDGGANNETFTPNETITLSNGNYNMIVYVADAVGNENSTNVSFTVDKQTKSSSGGGGGHRNSNDWICSKWERWSVCNDDGVQYRKCAEMEDVGWKGEYTKKELENLVQNQSCSFRIVQASDLDYGSDDLDSETLEPIEDLDEEGISGITGAVVGFAKSGKGLTTILIILALFLAFGAVQFNRRKLKTN